MLAFEAFDALHGDALVLRWGDAQQPRTALVDGGPGRVWRTRIRPRLLELAGPQQPPALDWVLVSHVDDDHIGGVQRLLDELRDAQSGKQAPPFTIDRLWHNSLDDLVIGGQLTDRAMAASVRRALRAPSLQAVGQSVDQGRDVRNAASVLGLAGNQPLGRIVRCGDHADIAGLAITVVGPRLDQLEKQWENWRRILQKRDVRAAAAAYTDRSVFNQASIAAMVEFDGRRLLLTGDARGDHLLTGLEEARLLDSAGRLHVDIFKLPHHGSAANTSQDLFDAVTADHYVVSASGRHGHPSREVFDQIIASRNKEKFTFHLTNRVIEPYDVLAYLSRVGDGKSFDVQIRSPDRPSVEITLVS